VNLRRKEFGDAGDVVFGLAQTANPDTASLASDLLVVPGQMAYMHIPYGIAKFRRWAGSESGEKSNR